MVRPALNYAINRNKIARPVRRASFATPTCQPLALARGQSPVGGPGSGVVVFVPQLVSKAARRGDRLDGEAVFEAA